MIGIPVYQEGNVIDLGVQKIQVVEACSGLRYLFPLMSFGFLVALIYQSSPWKRAVIFFSTIPITLLMNALRIALIGLLVKNWGPKMAEGLIHDMEGWVVFVICIAVLMAEVWLLSRIGAGGGRLKLESIGVPHPFSYHPHMNLRGAGIAALAICVVMTSALWIMDLKNRQEHVPPRTPFFTFPLTLGQWQGRQERIEAAVLQSLQLTDYWNATYSNPAEGAAVNLYIAYYASQRLGTAAHSPENCIPGSGWEIKEKDTVGVAVEGRTLPVTRMLIARGKTNMLIYYWFEQRGRVMGGQYGAKWYLLVDSIIKKRTDGSVIRLITSVEDGADILRADEKMKGFLRGFYPQIKKHVPE